MSLGDWSKKLPITSITPFTFQDFPEHTACILWFSGCNMACGYCHNPELVRGELKKLDFERVQGFLESRRGLLEGVVLSGGECTISPALPEFIKYLKSLGFRVKVDTNGTNPDMLESLLAKGWLDYVAIDFKAPRTKFMSVTRLDRYDLFERSLKLLCASNIEFEVRTTVHTEQLNIDDINIIVTELLHFGFKGKYFIQQFRQGATLGNLASPAHKLDLARLIDTNFTIQFRNF